MRRADRLFQIVQLLRRRRMVTTAKLFAPATRSGARSADALAMVREALVERRRMRLRYENERGDRTDRTVRPLGVFFWGKTWTLAAWCEMRVDFRNFRLDRVSESALL